MSPASAFSATWNAICGKVNVTELLASCCTLSVAVPVVWFDQRVVLGRSGKQPRRELERRHARADLHPAAHLQAVLQAGAGKKPAFSSRLFFQPTDPDRMRFVAT